MKHSIIKFLIIILIKKILSQIQTFNITSINFSSQCCGLLKNFSFTLNLDSISLYSSKLDNIIYLESEDLYDLEMKINTTCFLEINSSKINCITNEDVSLLARGPFRVPRFDTEIIFTCKNNKKENFTCQINPFDIEDNVVYSYSASIYSKQQISPQIFYKNQNLKKVFVIKFDYYNGYKPVVFVRGKRTTCYFKRKDNLNLYCTIGNHLFPIYNEDSITYKIMVLNDCGVVQDIGLEIITYGNKFYYTFEYYWPLVCLIIGYILV